MQKVFSIEGGFYKTLDLIKDIMILNGLMLLFSLPLFTIGASLSAAFSVSFKLVMEEEIVVFDYFIKEFKSRFKVSTKVFLIHLVVLAMFVSIIKFVGIDILAFPLLIIFTVYLLMNEILFPLIGLKDLSLKQLYHESFAMTLNYLVLLVISFILTVIWALFPIYFLKLSFIWLMLGTGSMIYLKARLFKSMLIKLTYLNEKVDE